MKYDLASARFLGTYSYAPDVHDLGFVENDGLCSNDGKPAVVRWWDGRNNFWECAECLLADTCDHDTGVEVLENPVDVHAAGPADCPACVPFRGGPVACLSHTCPDCGSIVHAETNERGELTHRCP